MDQFDYSKLFLGLIALFAVHFSAPIMAQENRDWLEVTTDNFTIRSTLNENKTVELAHHLELFRAAISLLTSITNTESPIPTEIYVLESFSDFSRLGGDSDIGGYFVPGMRENLIFMREVQGMSETSIILHEYVHFLMRNQGSQIYPRWFDEGLADFLGSSELRRGKFSIGVIPEARETTLMWSRSNPSAFTPWIPLRDIINPVGYENWFSERQAMFYAQSWALVHYLQTHPEGKQLYAGGMGNYMRRISAEGNSIEAFESAFGISAEDIDDAVEKYTVGNVFRTFAFDPDVILPDFQYQVSELTKEQAALGLAKIAATFGEEGKAEELYSIATEAPDTAARSYAGLGDLYSQQGELAQALAQYETALELDESDATIWLSLANHWHSRAQNNPTTFSLDKAQQNYLEAWKLDNSIPELYALYGSTLLMEGKDIEKAVQMLEEAEYLLPSSIQIRFVLASAYLEAGQYADALDYATSVVAWSHENSAIGEQAQRIIAQAQRQLALR